MTKEEQDKIRRSPAYAEGWRTHRIWKENGQRWPAGMEKAAYVPAEYRGKPEEDCWRFATFSATGHTYGLWPTNLPPILEPLYEQVQLDLFD